MLFVLISVCHDIDQWPFPEAGHTLQLPLMGNVMQVWHYYIDLYVVSVKLDPC